MPLPFARAIPGVAAMAGYSMGLAVGTNIPIEHLDYNYISKCNKASEIEKILRVLRRVKHGRRAFLDRYRIKYLFLA